jgi:hypothetical protein
MDEKTYTWTERLCNEEIETTVKISSVPPFEPMFFYRNLTDGTAGPWPGQESAKIAALVREVMRLAVSKQRLLFAPRDARERALRDVLSGLRSESDSQQLRAIIASVEALLERTINPDIEPEQG